MDEISKKLVVVGDRVLVTPEEGEERSSVGLYLPPTAMDRQAVQGGRIVATGTPEHIARNRGSHTGTVLARELDAGR